MRFALRSCLAGFAALLVAGCVSPAATPASTLGPSSSSHSVGGGCAGTVLTYAEPPRWAQGGWQHEKGTPWAVPWAFGRPKDAIAYVWAGHLVAGVDTKVLWVVDGTPNRFVVEGRPIGKSKPVVTVLGGPSKLNIPSSGCWTFRLQWSDPGPSRTSIINLDVSNPA